LKKEKFDLVHLNSSKAGFIGALANVLAGRPSKVIYTAHGWVYLEPLPWLTKKIYLWLEKIAARLRDATIVLSEAEKQVAIKYGTASVNSLAVIPQGLDFSKLKFLPREEARQALALTNQKSEIKNLKSEIIIGTIANNYPTKGLKYLDEAAKQINQVFHVLGFKFQTMVIGESFGSTWHNLKTLGHKDDAYQYLRALDIFVLPSIKEGFPFVLLEALAAGLAIVATTVGAIPEIIKDGETGLLVPPRNAEAISQAILKLISDTNLRQKLGANATARSQDFDWQTTLQKTKNLYHSLI